MQTYGIWKLNSDQVTRDAIIGLDPAQEYAVPRISITIEQLEQLIEQRFANPDERQNEAPSIGDLLYKVKNYLPQSAAEIRFIGYVVSKPREDYRVSIDGIEIEGEISAELRKVFQREFCYGSDEYTASQTELRVWWD